MCEAVAEKSSGWRGWMDLPAPEVSSVLGAWVDLSHRITETLSRSPMFPQPRIQKIISMPEHLSNVTEMQMVVHHGTHIDAPRHFIADGPSMDEIPLERLYGQGVVWRIDVPAHGVIGVSDLERATPKMKPGDIVYLDTGWAQYVNTEHYENHASLSPEASEWLVAQGAKLVGVDFSTPDLTAHRRPADFRWPVHQILLRSGVLIAEHMTNLKMLAGRRIETMFLAINIAGSDGAPARVIARPIA